MTESNIWNIYILTSISSVKNVRIYVCAGAQMCACIHIFACLCVSGRWKHSYWNWVYTQHKAPCWSSSSSQFILWTAASFMAQDTTGSHASGILSPSRLLQYCCYAGQAFQHWGNWLEELTALCSAPSMIKTSILSYILYLVHFREISKKRTGDNCVNGDIEFK